jgi:hypothetical protein
MKKPSGKKVFSSNSETRRINIMKETEKPKGLSKGKYPLNAQSFMRSEREIRCRNN